MFADNFTQDKSKILIDDKGRVQKSNIKSEINKLLLAIKGIYTKYPTFSFGIKNLNNFLLGIDDNVINAFKLQREDGFGMFSNKNSYYIMKIINVLIDLNVLEKNKNEKGYEGICLKQDTLSDNQIYVLKDLLF